MSDALIDVVAEVLERLTPPRWWMTARDLVRTLRREAHGEWQLPPTEEAAAAELDARLRAHATGTPRRVRWCWYPSPKTLDVLWGSVRNVGEKAAPSLQRQDDPVEDVWSDERPGGAPWFVSHSHHDAAFSLELMRWADQQEIPMWLAEIEIPRGEVIPTAVKKGLAASRGALFVLSARSLGSTWVMKELGGAMQRGGPSVIVLAPGDNTLYRAAARLLSHAGWDSQTRTFVATENRCSWGEAQTARDAFFDELHAKDPNYDMGRARALFDALGTDSDQWRKVFSWVGDLGGGRAGLAAVLRSPNV